MSIPRTTCWPTETHYFLIRNSSDKTKWIAGLQSAVNAGSLLNVNSNKFTLVFSDNCDLGVNCVEEISERVSSYNGFVDCHVILNGFTMLGL